MAWIMKNSAAMAIDRRDEPYLTDRMKAELEADVLPRYPTRQAATLPVLHAVQHEHNYLPYQAVEEAAAFLGVSASEMLDTATFYEEYWLTPKGKYLIMVCQSISCELMNHGQLLEMIQDKLGIGPGETTDDGKFTLMTAECLGSCGTAPCALIDETLHENLTAENFDAQIGALQ
ncbi:MAG: NADH-quinone oxidoreductase subunit NuoE [Phycisphaeraceae bacterium]|jgi:NADH-quinone oxidoreductase subunit E|nr:NADH-quinone oxidoreductase subunit NuoE [Phycisphaeraceae bacterium]